MAAGAKVPVRDGPAQEEEEEEEEGFLYEAQLTHEEDNALQMGKVRKRGSSKMRRTPSVCSSVRGSSVAISGLRLRRASQLAGRRWGLSTPVPSWKVVRNDSTDAQAVGKGHQNHLQTGHASVGLVSARKLAASLWELQAVPFSGVGVPKSKESYWPHHDTSLGAAGKPFVDAYSAASSRISQRLPKPPSILATNKLNAARSRGNAQTFSENSTQAPAISNEFVKVLNHVRSLEEQHRSSTLLVDRLHHELDESHRQLQELTQSERIHRKEVENITKKLVEERALWKKQQKESIAMAMQTITEELYHERRSKSWLESGYRKMGKEYSELKKALVKALRDLERERKARELMEDVCDELAREIGEDKARVEEMKRESVKVREEVEEERKMLQMAEMWREERVQMKLMEAKLELEEKNMALDKLRGELEAFLKAKRAVNMGLEGNQVALSATQDRHDRESPIVGRHLGDSFHPQDAVVPGRPYELQPSSLSRARQNPKEYKGEDGSSLKYEPRDNDQYHQGYCQEGERFPSHPRISSPGQWQASPGRLHRTRSSHLKEGTRPANNHHIVDTQGDQWIKGESERGVMKAWSEERPASRAVDGCDETMNMWPSESEGSQGWSSFSPGPARKTIEPHVEERPNNTNAAHQLVGSPQDIPSPSVFLSPIRQQSHVKSSPTHPWQFWSSPDLGSPHQQAKSKGSLPMDMDMAYGPKNYSLKARLLEAKLEGQQASRLRAGTG